MSLVVGELVGYIRLEDQTVQPALNRVQSAMQSAGQRMAATAGQAGTTAGRALGDGVGEGARTGLTGLTTTARTEGNQAGGALGDGLTDGARAGGDDAATAAEGGLSKLKATALGIGAAAGAVLMSALGTAMEQGQVTGKLAASLGATPAEAKRYGQIAGRMYADAVTEDFQGAADAIGATMSAGIAPPDATNKQIQSIATKVHDLSDTFELDLGQAANAVGQILKTGLAKDGTEALDVMTRGMQVMGPRADDLADTFNEYSTIFRQLGISAGDATGILSQGMAAGARDTDVVADSLKELTLITQGGGAKVDAAFSKIGLSGKAMQTAFAKGGPTAKAALDQIFDGLRKVKDPAERSQLAVSLFGTKAEDMQKALFSIDPSKAISGLGKVDGAAARAGNSIRDNAGTQIESFKRKAMQGLVDIIGGKVLPVIMKFATYFNTNLMPPIRAVAGIISATLMPALTTLSGWMSEHTTTVAIIAGLIGGALVGALTAMAVTATISAATTVIAWVTTGAAAIGSAATQVLAGAGVVATWVLMGLQSMLQAARMAAAWFIAMGPVGWVIAAIVGLAVLIFLYWDQIVAATTKAWDWVWSKIKGVGAAILSYIKNIPLVKWFLDHWDGIKSGTVTKITGLIGYVRGLPGRISGAIGGMKDLLYNKGRDIVLGLWHGIQGMGSWLRGQLMSFASNMIPGPIAKALGIGSPSKVMAKEVGRWIPAGIVKGIDSGSGALDRTMSNLVSTPGSGGMAYSGGSSMASGAGGRGGGQRIELVINSSGNRADEAILGVVRNSIQVKGGNVNYALTGRR